MTCHGFRGKFSLFKPANGFTETRFSAKFRGASGLSKKDVHLDLPFKSCSDWDLNNKKAKVFSPKD